MRRKVSGEGSGRGVIRGRRPAVLPNYFDKEAMSLITRCFWSTVKCDLNNGEEVQKLKGGKTGF